MAPESPGAVLVVGIQLADCSTTNGTSRGPGPMPRAVASWIMAHARY
jgi:hypothetical protein